MKETPCMGNDGGSGYSEEVNDDVQVIESAFVNKMDDEGRTVGLVASRGDPDGRFSEADLDQSGRVVSRTGGRPSPKALSELRVANLFVQRLNQLGAQWEQPTPLLPEAPEEGVDCIAVGPGGALLKIQVTTPEVVAWKHLAQSSEPWLTDDEVHHVAEAMWTAIEKKHLKAHPDIYLVLDATDSVRFALSLVVERFRSAYGDRARGRFAEVWIAGPVAEAVMRLDA
jgi:hypothetical protein